MPEQSILWATTAALQHGQMYKELIMHLFVLKVTCTVDCPGVNKVEYFVDLTRWLFKYLLDPQYKIGTLGASECPNGYKHIQSLSGCNAARNELSFSVWNGERFINNGQRLPYCWVGTGGGANYNSNGDTGQNPPPSRLICENDRKRYSKSWWGKIDNL